MSLFHNRLRRTDRGFTLIEVIVSLGLLALVTAAVVPQVIAGLRAAGTARDVTQAKGVAQAQLEVMRNMPFFVGRSAGDYIDVLDSYYRDLTVPATNAVCLDGDEYTYPPTSWSGYVPASNTARCEYEPATGAFYRKVINPVEAPGLGAFSMVIDTQFLSADKDPQPVTPPTVYNSQVAGRDVPAAMQLGVTTTVFYQTQNGPRWTSTYTQIERTVPISPLIVSEAAASSVRVSSMTDPTTNLTSDVGVVNLTGELFTGSRVNAYATAGVAGNSLGTQINAAAKNAVAPEDTGVLSALLGGVALNGTCDYACFGQSLVERVSAAASDGLPLAGTPLEPVSAALPTSTTLRGFQFSNGYSGSRLRLDTSQPMVSMDTGATASMSNVENCAFTGSNPAYLRATGYLNAISGNSASVESCVTSQTGWIKLLPTTYAPDGLIRIYLTEAAAQCVVSTSAGVKTPTASARYLAVVSHWDGGGYTSNLVTETSGDVLAGIDLDTVVHSPSGLRLRDYISSWRSLAPTDIIKKTSNGTAEVDVQGIITIDTMPTREDVAGGIAPNSHDPSSVISLQVGALSCKAGDYR